MEQQRQELTKVAKSLLRDTGICGVAMSLTFFAPCLIAVNNLPSCGVAVILNRAVCGVYDSKPAVSTETKQLADLWFIIWYRSYQHEEPGKTRQNDLNYPQLPKTINNDQN